MFLSVLPWNKYVFRQCLVGLIVTIDVFLLGAGYTFSATLLPQLERSNSSIEITRNEGTWIASISSLACIPGTILGFFLLQIFGRKYSYSIISLSNFAAWGTLALSTQVWHLLFGRTLQGFNAGLGYAVCFCFISEVSDLRYRSILLNMINIGASLGMLFVDCIGSYYPWQTSAYFLTSISALYFIILLYLKNTHVWYLQRGDVERAKELYFWYKQPNLENEQNFSIERKLAESKVSFKELTQEWKRREFLAPLGIMLWFNATIMCTGGFGIMLYSVEIMEGVVSIDEYMTTVLIDILRVLSTFVAIMLLGFTSVRLVLNLSSIFCAFSLLTISLALYLRDSWTGWSSIALAGILTFNFFFNLGYVNLGNICVGELFTGIGKSSGTAIAGTQFFILYFAFGQIVPVMFDDLGNVVSFFIFGVCTLIGGFGMYCFMPETKGVSNEQIRLNFQKKTRRESKNCENLQQIQSISCNIPTV